MTWLRIALSRFRGMFRRIDSEAELQSEMESHIDLLTQKHLRSGLSPENARQAARREFGGIEQAKETYRDFRGLPALDVLWQDLRFAWRSLVKRPAFTLAILLTLAVSIGAAGSVFSAVDRILFRSLPYPQADRLVSYGFVAPIEPIEFMLGTDYSEWRAAQSPFAGVTSMRPGTAPCDLTEQNPIRLSCASVEATFLPVFGLDPILGRNFTRDEDRPNAPRVGLITHALWLSRFGGNPAVIDQTISLDGHPTRIVGVLPPSFEMPTLSAVDVLLPQALEESAQKRPNAGAVLRTFARLKPGVSEVQAAAALEPLFQQSLEFVPAQFRKEVRLRVRSLRDRQVQDAKLTSWFLLAAVFGVLLIACANVGNLLLARSAAREREIAVRAALGAGRVRLLRQSLTESLVLSLTGGALGCSFAVVLLHVFVSIAPHGIPRLDHATIDLRVIAFSLAVAVLSGVFFGLMPALRQPLPELLVGRVHRPSTRFGFRQSGIAVHLALSLILLACAGLLLRSLWNLQNTDLGLHADSVIAESISLGESRYPDVAQQLNFFERLLPRVSQLPGVQAAALSDSLPPSGPMRATVFAGMEVAGRPPFEKGTGGMVGWRVITPHYFSVLAIPILQGRPFREGDAAPGENPVILSESLAHALLQGENPLGKQMRFGRQGPWRTIVGVARDVHNNGLQAGADPEFYLPWKNDPIIALDSAFVLVRAELPPKAVSAWMRSETAQLDATLPVSIDTLSQRVSKLTQGPKFNAFLLSLFAFIALVLAAVGLYGLVAFLVTQRIREIGVRMALGATPAEILKMVLGNVARWTFAGVLLGLAGSWFATRLLESLLFEVAPHDPVLLTSAALTLILVTFLAAWIPARRAMRVDPLVALRYE
jgi:putative ABC transport system permease protein